MLWPHRVLGVSAEEHGLHDVGVPRLVVLHGRARPGPRGRESQVSQPATRERARGDWRVETGDWRLEAVQLV